jgi:xylan 1,4-beta-xylosidase
MACDRADVSALASRGARSVTVLAWHYHDDDVAGPSADVRLDIGGLPETSSCRVRRLVVDSTHGNAFTAWQKMGSPAQPDASEIDRLRTASVLPELADMAAVSNRSATLHFVLPRHAVSLVVFSW